MMLSASNIKPSLSHYLTDIQVAERRIDNRIHSLQNTELPNRPYFEVNMHDMKSELRQAAEDLKDFRDITDYFVDISPEYRQFKAEHLSNTQGGQ